ncbi:MAG: hypothetical protein ACPGGA_06685 [Balneolaceae bacterium]
MSTVIASNQLDFEFIKGRIIEYMKTQSEFKDYDFEASGLSAIADVLAFNTHQNALIGNFAINESFLQTAQLRASIVNHGLNFAYIPRSKTAPIAYVNLTLNLSAAATKPQIIALPSGTEFTTTLDEVTYTFRTQDIYYATIDPAGVGIYTFRDENGQLAVPIREGVERTKTFLVETSQERQIYVIPDDTLDLGTLKVRVYEDNADTEGQAYLTINQLFGGFTADTRLYLPLETYNGFYELNFGDGRLTGDAPKPGNIIKARYLSSNGPAANGASIFIPSSTVSVDGTSYNLTVTTVTKATLGAEKESAESIRQNAPLNYLAQGRLITPLDYVAVISNSIPGIKSINAWGGEDNVPIPKFGKVLISIIYESDIDATTKTLIEQQITSQLTDQLSITSIDSEIVTPEFTYLNVTSTLNYNPTITALSKRALETKIQNSVTTYFNNNLGKFNQIFRKSKLNSYIDASDPSILSSKISIEMESRFTPVYDALAVKFITADYTLQFLSTLAAPDAEVAVINSDKFTFKGKTCFIRNVIGANASTKLQILDTDENIVVSEIGRYEPSTGKVILTGFAPSSISSGDTFLRITAKPADDSTIKPLRNNVINLNTNSVSALADANIANSTVV